MVELHTLCESLCVDILLELFRYLYADEIFKNFNYVLHNLPLLLNRANLPLHVRYVDAYFRKHILPNINVDNVKSIRIPNMYHMAPVNLSQFNCVQLLILHNVTELNWPKYFPNNVKYLIIHVRSKHRHEVFRKALSLDHIQILEFHSTFLHFDDCDDKLTKPSPIKHLIFNSKQCFIHYQFLINNMPNLLSLRSVNTHYPYRCKLNGNIFRNLRTINLTCKHIDIDEMIDFLTHVAIGSLRRCRLINIENSLSSGIAYVLIS